MLNSEDGKEPVQIPVQVAQHRAVPNELKKKSQHVELVAGREVNQISQIPPTRRERKGLWKPAALVQTQSK